MTLLELTVFLNLHFFHHYIIWQTRRFFVWLEPFYLVLDAWRLVGALFFGLGFLESFWFLSVINPAWWLRLRYLVQKANFLIYDLQCLYTLKSLRLFAGLTYKLGLNKKHLLLFLTFGAQKFSHSTDTRLRSHMMRGRKSLTIFYWILVRHFL